MWRWIFVVGGGVVVLKVAADALADTYRERPLSTGIGCALVVAVVAVLASALLADRDGRGIELRRASEEYGPSTAPAPEGAVEHVVHHLVRVEHTHVVEHVHRYVGGAGHARGPGSGPVVDGQVVVRRAIEGGTT